MGLHAKTLWRKPCFPILRTEIVARGTFRVCYCVRFALNMDHEEFVDRLYSSGLLVDSEDEFDYHAHEVECFEHFGMETDGLEEEEEEEIDVHSIEVSGFEDCEIEPGGVDSPGGVNVPAGQMIDFDRELFAQSIEDVISALHVTAVFIPPELDIVVGRLFEWLIVSRRPYIQDR